MQNILITGANRGIGLALVEQYLAVGGYRVFASCRNPEAATALNALTQANPQTLRTLQMDVDDEASIKRAVDTIGADSDRLDALINNAGVSGGDDTRSMGQLGSVAVAGVITTNAVAPLIVTQACRDLLKRSDNPRVVMISSGLGSLARVDGNAYAYRMSKAAMNMAARVLAFDEAMAGIRTVTLAPGWVRTDMGGPSANLAPEESASALLALIEKLGATDNGRFYRYDGLEMDW